MAPDNSMRAFRLAVEHGADGIETDLRFTRDGTVVLSHDAEINGYGAVIDRSFAELRANQPQVPTLDEMVSESGDLLLNLEIKNHPSDVDFDPRHRMAESVAEWVTANNLGHRVLVSSFNPGTVDRVREVAPEIATGLLLAHGRGILHELRGAVEAGHQWLLPRRSALRFRPRRLVKKVQAAGLRLGTWTVDAVEEMRRLDRAHVDAIITDNPRRALETYA